VRSSAFANLPRRRCVRADIAVSFLLTHTMLVRLQTASLMSAPLSQSEAWKLYLSVGAYIAGPIIYVSSELCRVCCTVSRLVVRGLRPPLRAVLAQLSRVVAVPRCCGCPASLLRPCAVHSKTASPHGSPCLTPVATHLSRSRPCPCFNSSSARTSATCCTKSCAS
jgi:hypothetical protein